MKLPKRTTFIYDTSSEEKANKFYYSIIECYFASTEVEIRKRPDGIYIVEVHVYGAMAEKVENFILKYQE